MSANPTNRKREQREALRRLMLLAAPFLCAFLVLRASSWVSELGHAHNKSEPDLIPGLSTKFQCVQKERDRLTGVYLGSSSVYNALDPTTIDNVLERAGVPGRSLNLAFHGTTLSEEYLILKALLDKRPPMLRWLLLDVSMALDPLLEQNEFTSRDLWGHSWPEPALHASWILKSTETPWDKAGALLKEGRTVFEQAASAGRAAQIAGFWLSHLIANTRAFRDPPSACDHRGYLPQAIDWEKYDAYYDLIHFYEQALGGTGLFLEPDEARKQEVLRIQRLAEDSGLKVVYIVMPVLAPYRPPEGETTLFFNNPEKYPFLYDPENRATSNHLSEDCSEKLSELVGHDLAGILLKAPGVGSRIPAAEDPTATKEGWPWTEESPGPNRFSRENEQRAGP